MKFRADIEGLRAIAVVPVVLYHANTSLVPGGYIGVDVFFVISGFLISKIILEGVDDGSFSYSSFYKRRIRRIFPALFFMLSAVSLAVFFILPPAALSEFGKTLAATTLFISNIEFDRLGGYFGGVTDLRPLLHTWSLAVEEQFYIFLPIVLIATKRWLRSRFLIVIVASTILSALMSVWLVMRHHPNAAFYFGPPRVFELMIGATLAINALPQLSGRISREIIAVLGMGMIATSAFAFNQDTSFSGLSALFPCLGAAGIIYSGQSGQSTTAKLLSLPAIRFVGAISYSLYLWHWPVLALARNYFLTALTPLQTFCAVLLATAMAVISWRFVEMPFRLRAQQDEPIFEAAGTLMTGAVALGAVMILCAGFPERFPTESQRLFQYTNDFNPRRETCHGGTNHNIRYADNCYFGDSNAQTVVAVWGDSHGSELSVALGAMIGAGHSVMEITYSGCPPALDLNMRNTPECAAHNLETIVNIVRDQRVRTVILIGRYSIYFQRGYRRQFNLGFEKTIARLVASGKKVIVVYPVPVFPYPVPAALGMAISRGQSVENYYLARSQYRKDNELAINDLDYATTKYHLPRLLTEEVFCSRQYCIPYDGHDALYFDNNHMSVSGARKLAAAIKSLL